MTLDISNVIRDWEFDPDEVTVRTINAEDGRELVQLRLDLGLMQMEIDGRPDGREVNGSPSWLDFHAGRQQSHDAANPDGAPYLLQPEDCAELMREGVQYYHRYVSLWSLKRYELCARDTERNLRLFRFVREHAQRDQDKLQFDQWRPYVTMMHTRAVATPLVELRQWQAAVSSIDAGIRGIEQFLSDYGREDQAENINELSFLRRWRDEVVEAEQRESGEQPVTPPPDPVDRLRQELADAVEGERYEEAANLRDEIRRLEDPSPPGR